MSLALDRYSAVTNKMVDKTSNYQVRLIERSLAQEVIIIKRTLGQDLAQCCDIVEEPDSLVVVACDKTKFVTATEFKDPSLLQTHAKMHFRSRCPTTSYISLNVLVSLQAMRSYLTYSYKIPDVEYKPLSSVHRPF